MENQIWHNETILTNYKMFYFSKFYHVDQISNACLFDFGTIQLNLWQNGQFILYALQLWQFFPQFFWCYLKIIEMIWLASICRSQDPRDLLSPWDSKGLLRWPWQWSSTGWKPCFLFLKMIMRATQPLTKLHPCKFTRSKAASD